MVVRLSVAQGHWAEDIPPVPAGSAVTVSFGSQAVADEHCDALRLLGYHVVDIDRVPGLTLPDIADFLVTDDLIERHPTYWRSLAGQASRAYHLALGPARAAVADIVAAHAGFSGR